MDQQVKQLDDLDIDRLKSLIEGYRSEGGGDNLSGIARDAGLAAEALHFSGVIKKDLTSISTQVRESPSHSALIPLYIIFAKAFVYGRRYQHSLDEEARLGL